MQAGKLRKRVALQAKAGTQDPLTGQMTGTWSTEATVWGAVEPLQGVEKFRAEQINPELSHKVTVRYGTNIAPTPAKRWQWNGKNFNIESVTNPEYRNKMIECLCTEQVTV